MMTSTGLCAQIACVWEATARKPGNVHRYHDFEDAGYLDYLLSAAAIAPVLDRAPDWRVGETVLEAIRATRQVTSSNTNLGVVLLLAPLAAVPASHPLRQGVAAVLDDLDVEDARQAYDAIRFAAPSSLGQVADQDILTVPTQTLRQVMVLAAERDLVARQYANGFRTVFDEGVSSLERGLQETACLEDAIIFCQLNLLARNHDSLIGRKRGVAEAAEAGRRAGRVLAAGWPRGDAARAALEELDGWLRAEGHKRNPGTTADLVAASLFVALREGIITVPPKLPWTV
jgi:triphosphoribosyl-dephospho-CoA synthase